MKSFFDQPKENVVETNAYGSRGAKALRFRPKSTPCGDLSDEIIQTFLHSLFAENGVAAAKHKKVFPGMQNRFALRSKRIANNRTPAKRAIANGSTRTNGIISTQSIKLGEQSVRDSNSTLGRRKKASERFIVSVFEFLGGPNHG